MFASLRHEPEYNKCLTWLVGWRCPDQASEAYAKLLPTIDLTQVDQEKMSKVAQVLAQRFAEKGNLAQALDWTLSLPSGMAPQARLDVVSKRPLSDAKQRTAAEQWIRNATISEGERVSLLQITSQRMQFQAGVK